LRRKENLKETPLSIRQREICIVVQIEFPQSPQFNSSTNENFSPGHSTTTHPPIRRIRRPQEYSVQLTFREQWTDERLKFDDIQG